MPNVASFDTVRVDVDIIKQHKQTPSISKTAHHASTEKTSVLSPDQVTEVVSASNNIQMPYGMREDDLFLPFSLHCK